MTDSDASRHEEELRAELRAALGRINDRTGAPPAADRPAADAPMVEPPTVDEPMVEPPTVDEPMVEPPTVDEPTVLPLAGDGPPVEPPVDATTAAPEATAPVLVATEPPAEPVADDEAQPVVASKRHSSLKSGLEWVAVVIGALVVALVVKTFLFQAFYIPSASMEPTLEEGDRVLVNKVSYDLHDVHRGDVIVFELDDEDVGPDGIKDLIKRVIGLPGDEIESRDGVVYVNDHALDEPYLADGMVTGDPQDSRNPPIEPQTVPADHVFVLGDNRSNSADSRYPYRGPIPIDAIVGRAFVLVWPPGDVGTL